MGIRGLPKSHLHHIYTQLLGDNADQKLVRQLQAAGARGVVEALAKIEEAAPGTTNTLAEAWDSYGGNAVHLWGLTFLKEYDGGEVSKILRRRLGAGYKPGVRMALPANTEMARVVWIEAQDGVIEASVRLRLERYITFEDSVIPQPYSTDVHIRVDLSHPDRIAEVFAAHQNAKMAVDALTQLLRGLPTPTARSDREGILAPVNFTESQMKRVAARLKLKKFGVGCEDALGVLGELHFRGPKNGTRRMPLDFSDERVAPQERDGKDGLHEWTYDFVHPDGYVEYSEVAFYFNTSQPHISFRKRTSKLAIRRLLDEIAREIRGRR